jgi:hypothetical protein
MITEQELKQYKEWGLHLIPLKDDTKKPVSKPYWKKNGTGKLERHDSWKWNEHGDYLKFSDEEILEAQRVGINHEACSVIDVDCDALEGSQFMSEFPDTLTIGKKVDGSTYIRKKIYFYDGLTEHKSFGKDTEYGSVIENLAHTQSFCFGKDRITLNNVKPTTLSNDQYKRLKESVREVYALTMLAKYYPKKDTFRDKFSMALTGTLLRQTNWNDNKIKNFIERLCNAVGDNAVNKRTEKIGRFRENLDKEEKKVFGVKKLTELCGVDNKIGLDFIDAIKPEKEKTTRKEIVTLKLGEFLTKDYPKTEYLQFPITGKGKIVQVWANAGHGKTWFCLEWGGTIVNGHNFLKWNCCDGGKVDPHPVLYVEGEMSVSELQDRLLLIEKRYLAEGKTFNKDYFYIAPLREQPEQTFESLTSKAGRDNVENTAKRIFKETGKKPFIFLDNITALTVMQEKEGADWVELVQWLNRLRAQDYGVIFMHHGTKAGDTSSGSNLKERSIDISIHLSIPEDEELLEIDEEKNTQIKIQFDKWREFNFTKHSKPFIAVLNRDTTRWSHEPLLSKKQREVKKFLDQGLSPQEIIKKTKISQATVYRIIKQLGQEIKEEKKDEKHHF